MELANQSYTDVKWRLLNIPRKGHPRLVRLNGERPCWDIAGGNDAVSSKLYMEPKSAL